MFYILFHCFRCIFEFADLTSLNYRILIYVMCDCTDYKGLKLVKVFRLIRLLKLVRMFKLSKIMKSVEENIDINPAVSHAALVLLINVLLIRGRIN